MELKLTRSNMYNFPTYVKVFKDYPLINEIHVYSKWVFGFFGNEYCHYVKINKSTGVNPRLFDNYVYHSRMDFRLEKDLSIFKEISEKIPD